MKYPSSHNPGCSLQFYPLSPDHPNVPKVIVESSPTSFFHLCTETIIIIKYPNKCVKIIWNNFCLKLNVFKDVLT